jgi:hypothetical protein
MKPEELKSYDKQNQNEKLKDKNIKKQQFRFLKLFNQKHNIVIHIRRSSAKTARFKKLTGRMILINNRTK